MSMSEAAAAEPDDDVAVEVENWPPYARELWALTRRNIRAVDQLRLENGQQHAAVTAVIGKPCDDRGIGGTGLAGEVSGLRHVIGDEPDADGHGGRGILGRLAGHDRDKRRTEGLIREIRGGILASGLLLAVIMFMARDELHHLFAVPVH